MDLQLSGKRVAVFGGSRGIGLAIVEAFVNESAHVAICARDGAEIDKVLSRLAGDGASVEGRSVDVTDKAAVAEWIASLEQGGGIDAAVMCVSALATGASEDDWKRSVEVDLLASVAIIAALTPALERGAQRHGDAALVYISTTVAREAVNLSPYGPVKSAMANYCKLTARELAAKKVRVNIVSPGMVYFEGGIWHKVEQLMPDRYAMAIGRSPTGRMAAPGEIADTVVFLASPRSSFTTGANVSIDGALTLGVQF